MLKLKILSTVKSAIDFAGTARKVVSEVIDLKEMIMNFNSDEKVIAAKSEAEVAELKAQGKEAVYIPGFQEVDIKQIAAHQLYAFRLSKNLVEALIARVTGGKK